MTLRNKVKGHSVRRRPYFTRFELFPLHVVGTRPHCVRDRDPWAYKRVTVKPGLWTGLDWTGLDMRMRVEVLLLVFRTTYTTSLNMDVVAWQSLAILNVNLK